jgi:hypothetical protein
MLHSVPHSSYLLYSEPNFLILYENIGLQHHVLLSIILIISEDLRIRGYSKFVIAFPGFKAAVG